MFTALHDALADMIKIHVSTDMVQVDGVKGRLRLTMSTPKIGLVSCAEISAQAHIDLVNVDAKALLAALKSTKKPPTSSAGYIQFGRFKLAGKELPPIKFPHVDLAKFTKWPDELSKAFIELFASTNCGNSPPSVFGWQALRKNNHFYAGSTNGSAARLYYRKIEGEDISLVTIPPAALGTVAKILPGKDAIEVQSSVAMCFLKTGITRHAIATADSEYNISLRDVIRLTKDEDVICIENAPFKDAYAKIKPFCLKDTETRWKLNDGKLNIAVESSIGSTMATVARNIPSEELLTFTIHVKQLPSLIKFNKPDITIVKNGNRVSRIIYEENGLKIILPCTA